MLLERRGGTQWLAQVLTYAHTLILWNNYLSNLSSIRSRFNKHSLFLEPSEGVNILGLRYFQQLPVICVRVQSSAPIFSLKADIFQKRRRLVLQHLQVFHFPCTYGLFLPWITKNASNIRGVQTSLYYCAIAGTIICIYLKCFLHLQICPECFRHLGSFLFLNYSFLCCYQQLV